MSTSVLTHVTYDWNTIEIRLMSDYDWHQIRLFWLIPFESPDCSCSCRRRRLFILRHGDCSLCMIPTDSWTAKTRPYSVWAFSYAYISLSGPILWINLIIVPWRRPRNCRSVVKLNFHYNTVWRTLWLHLNSFCLRSVESSCLKSILRCNQVPYGWSR